MLCIHIMSAKFKLYIKMHLAYSYLLKKFQRKDVAGVRLSIGVANMVEISTQNSIQ